jgi:hypothetical protein
MGVPFTTYRPGGRFYVEPDSREAVPGVTSILNMIGKPFLQDWAAKLAAERAVRSHDFISRMIEDAGEDAAVEYIKRAAKQYTKARADIGSEAHDLFERMMRGEDVGRQRSDLEPYRRHFAAWLEEVQPELLYAEDTVWSDTHGYAGSFDLIAKVDGAVTILDYKTSKAVYPDVALQLAAYAHADKVILAADGSEIPMPAIERAGVLHITPERAALHPVLAGDDVFDAFLLLRGIFDWSRGLSKDVVGRPVWTHGAVLTGTERRA